MKKNKKTVSQSTLNAFIARYEAHTHGKRPKVALEPTCVYYLAYGSNLSKYQMSYRCPSATPVCAVEVPDWTLEFRGVANVSPVYGETLQAGIWRITAECEFTLDRYEGYREGDQLRGMYRKEYIDVTFPEGSINRVMLYVMNGGGISTPSDTYYEGIQEGYADFGLPVDSLIAARESAVHQSYTRHKEESYWYPKVAKKPAPIAPLSKEEYIRLFDDPAEPDSFYDDIPDPFIDSDESPYDDRTDTKPGKVRTYTVEW